MHKSLAERLEVLRQLAAKYWRPLVSWMTGLSVLLNGLKALDLSVGQVPGVTGDRWLIVLGAGLFVLVRFPRVAVWITRLILGSPKPPANLPTLFRGPRPYAHGDVLPGRQREIEQTVGMMIESLGMRNFSAAGLSRLGGKAGLMRAYIEDAKTYVLHRTGVPDDQALLMLRQLISPAQTKWTQTAQAIGAALNTSAGQVEQVLNAFAEKYLVNRLPAEVAEGSAEVKESAQRYELMHEHLVQILTEAPDPVLQKAKDAEERLLFWMNRTRAVAAVHTESTSPPLSARVRSWTCNPCV